jgi:preprotein translocase subunit SecE
MADNNTSFVDQVKQWPAEVKNYIQDLQMEMRRVTWPSRSQVRGTTTVVIVTVFAFAAYFEVVDTIIARLIGKLFQVFIRQT